MTTRSFEHERSRCLATTRTVASWLERLDFHGIDPPGGDACARAMRDELHANFYDGVSRWIVELRERLGRLQVEAGAGAEAEAAPVRSRAAASMRQEPPIRDRVGMDQIPLARS